MHQHRLLLQLLFASCVASHGHKGGGSGEKGHHGRGGGSGEKGGHHGHRGGGEGHHGGSPHDPVLISGSGGKSVVEYKTTSDYTKTGRISSSAMGGHGVEGGGQCIPCQQKHQQNIESTHHRHGDGYRSHGGVLEITDARSSGAINEGGKVQSVTWHHGGGGTHHSGGGRGTHGEVDFTKSHHTKNGKGEFEVSVQRGKGGEGSQGYVSGAWGHVSWGKKGDGDDSSEESHAKSGSSHANHGSSHRQSETSTSITSKTTQTRRRTHGSTAPSSTHNGASTGTESHRATSHGSHQRFFQGAHNIGRKHESHRPSPKEANRRPAATRQEHVNLWFERFFGKHSSAWYKEIVVDQNIAQYNVFFDTGPGGKVGNETTASNSESKAGNTSESENNSTGSEGTDGTASNEGGSDNNWTYLPEGNDTTERTASAEPSPVPSSGAHTSDQQEPPLAAKAFALYLTVYGCWGSPVYNEFLNSYGGLEFPVEVDPDELQGDDGWLAALAAEEKANPSPGPMGRGFGRKGRGMDILLRKESTPSGPDSSLISQTPTISTGQLVQMNEAVGGSRMSSSSITTNTIISRKTGSGDIAGSSSVAGSGGIGSNAGSGGSTDGGSSIPNSSDGSSSIDGSSTGNSTFNGSSDGSSIVAGKSEGSTSVAAGNEGNNSDTSTADSNNGSGLALSGNNDSSLTTSETMTTTKITTTTTTTMNTANSVLSNASESGGDGGSSKNGSTDSNLSAGVANEATIPTSDGSSSLIGSTSNHSGIEVSTESSISGAGSSGAGSSGTNAGSGDGSNGGRIGSTDGSGSASGNSGSNDNTGGGSNGGSNQSTDASSSPKEANPSDGASGDNGVGSIGNPSSPTTDSASRDGKDGVGPVIPTVAEGRNTLRHLGAEEMCLVRQGRRELPLPAGIFVSFVTTKGCSNASLPIYKAFFAAMKEEVSKWKADGLKFPKRYFLVKAETMMYERFRQT